MAAVSLSAPPPPFSCHLCEGPSWADKAGPGCGGCPAFKGSHYFPNGEGPEDCDVLFLGDKPEAPPKRPGQPEAMVVFHPAFQCDGGKVIRSAAYDLGRRAQFKGLTARFIYGVKCAVDTPNKATILACQTPLKEELARIAAARRRSGKTRPLVIVALGTTALKSIGISVQSEKEASGRTYEHQIGDMHLTVVFAMSLKAIAVAVGKYASLLVDLERAYLAANDTSIEITPREELAVGYIIPKSIAEVRAVCELILSYSENGVPPEAWMISTDSETRTLYPWKHDVPKPAIAVSFSWAAGKATAITLWHPYAPYDPDEAWEIVKTVLEGPKPQAFHNAKFDLKVFRRHGVRRIKLGWDSMLAEHALEEDKKGLYGLKNLVKRFLPRYSGYEDKLGALLEELDRSDEIEGDEETPDMPEEKLPAAVQEALDLLVANKWIKNEKFQVPALTKKMDAFLGKGGDALDPIIQAARLLRNAKEGGEFRAKKPDKVDTLPEDGGFEELPLDEMLFYACVDADVTRQIAVIQVGRMNDEEAFIAQQRQSYAIAKQFGVGVFKYDAPVRPTRARPLYQLAREDYLPRAEVLADIEYRGVRVDRAYLAEAVKKLDAAIASTEMELRRLTDNPKFKPGSTKQLAYHLFDSGMGYVHPDPEKAQLMADRNPDSVRYVGGRILYRARAYTTHGAIQTTEAVLKSLVSRYEDPLADLVLTNKKASKARGSFMKSVDRLSSEAFGRGYIHPNYNLNGTSTGRLSSSSGVKGIGFNNQNIPKGELGGVKCKKLFITDDPETDLFVNIDAKGAEVSIFAAYARDMKLIEALVAGMDTHCFFSAKVLDPKIIGAGKSGEALRTALEAAGIDADHDWSYEDFFNREDMIKAGLGPNGMSKDGKELAKSLWADPALVSYGKRLKKLRDNIKRVVFGILYGAHAKKIASIAGIEEQLAQTIIELLFAMFPSIPEFVEATKWHLNTFGFVETFHGRRRRFSIKNAPGRLRSQAERRAVNFLIQGTNSDIVMMVLTAITPVIERELRGRVLGTVHDSVMFQIPKIYAGQLKDVVIEYGTKFVARECPWMNPIPYRWDIEVGPSYGELRPLEEYLSGQSAPATPVGLQGLTEEEIIDALRDATDDDEFKKTKKKKAAEKPAAEKEPA